MVNNLWTVDDVFNPKSEFWKKMYGDVDSYFNNMDKTEIDTIHKRAFQDRISDFVDYFKSLSNTDKPKVVKEIEQSEEIVTEVLWNLVGKNDREILFHNDIDYFNDFIDTCPDPLLEVYINKLASGESLLNYAVREHLKSGKEKKSTEKSNNIQSEENILEVNLDAYVEPSMSASTSGGNANPNNDFYSYYDNILGDIKLIVEFNLVNPKYYNIDVGEIIDFSDMYPETPFGHNSGNWSGLKFIVTDINRTCGSIKIKAREV